MKKILVVDDHLLAIQFVTDGLRGDGHYVDTATSITAAINLLNESVFDVLILDMLMPPGQGLPAEFGPFHGIALFGHIPNLINRDFVSLIVLTHNEDPRIDDGLRVQAARHSPPLEYLLVRHHEGFENVLRKIRRFISLNQRTLDLISRREIGAVGVGDEGNPLGEEELEQLLAWFRDLDPRGRELVFQSIVKEHDQR